MSVDIVVASDIHHGCPEERPCGGVLKCPRKPRATYLGAYCSGLYLYQHYDPILRM